MREVNPARSAPPSLPEPRLDRAANQHSATEDGKEHGHKVFVSQAGWPRVNLVSKKIVENDMFETSKLFKGRMMYFKKCH